VSLDSLPPLQNGPQKSSSADSHQQQSEVSAIPLKTDLFESETEYFLDYTDTDGAFSFYED
jgi:hypothetical protein